MPPKHLRLTVPISLTGLGAIFYGISMLAFANGNMTTALAVASNVEFIPTIAAMLIRAAPYLILPLVAYIVYRVRGLETDDENGSLLIIAVGLAITIAVIISSILTLIASFAVLMGHMLYLVSQKMNWKLHFKWAQFKPKIIQQLISSIFIVSVMISPSWLPNESAIIGNQQRVVSVIKQTDEFLYYLDTATNRVMYSKPADVTQRAFCGSGDIETLASLIRKMFMGQTYPNCPSKK